jgi:16S rRNA (guanine966-N2)-methyltransferase
MRNKRSHNKGEVRIIGGALRGRKIYFPELPGLRPTPNRVRETLFNWLAPYIQDACCLDLFAGSGALGFEALSRGARYCLLLDSSKEIVESLIENRSRLGVSHFDIFQSTFPYPTSFLKDNFNMVFIDPPFYKGYVQLAIEWLQNCQCLLSEALIYIESASDEQVITLPENWQLLKDKKAGHVRYSLIKVN